MPVTRLPADLPENMEWDQVIAPNGTDIGQPIQYGYNYLLQQVNAAQRAYNFLADNCPVFEMLTLYHNLNSLPIVQLLKYSYGAGIGGAGDTPAGGSDIMQISAQATYHDNDSLTIYTTKAVAFQARKAVQKLNNSEYIVLFSDDNIDSVYIRLI